MRRLPSLSALLLLSSFLAIPASAQQANVRPPVPVDGNAVTHGNDYAVGSDGDLTVIAFDPDGADSVILAAASDGRALKWAPPLRIDGDVQPLSSKTLSQESVQVVGDNAFVAWSDDRAGKALFLCRSLPGAVGWLPEVGAPRTYPASGMPLTHWRMKVVPAFPEPRVYLLVAERNPSGDDEMYLTVSADGGQTFGAPIPPSTLPPGTADVDRIALAAVGLTVHVAWLDDRNGDNDVWYQRSLDGGQTWLPSDVQVNVPMGDTGHALTQLEMDLHDHRIAIGWLEEFVAGNRELRLNVSENQGMDWSGADTVGEYTPGLADVSEFALTIGDNGYLIMAWVDDRLGFDQVYVSSSPQQGGTWSEFVLSLGPGDTLSIAPNSRNVDRGHEAVAVSWRTSYTRQPQMAFSSDNGFSWEGLVNLATSGSEPVLAMNAWYKNFIAAFRTGGEVCAGGLRPQTLSLIGAPLVEGAPFRFELRHFPPSDAGDRFHVLAGRSAGTALLPNDGRNLTLKPGPLFWHSMQIPELGGYLDQLGAGETPTLLFPSATKVPPGTRLYFLALTADGPSFGAITDMLKETVQ